MALLEDIAKGHARCTEYSECHALQARLEHGQHGVVEDPIPRTTYPVLVEDLH
jgi:hypothetical protein